MNCPVEKKCPYSSLNSDCLMTVGGVYLPLPEHVETFCKTVNYSKCYHYIVGCEEIKNAAPKIEDGVVNRRRYRRVMERIPIMLSEDMGEGLSVDVIDDNAYTFDISMGGVGLVTKRKISPDTKVKFTLMDTGENAPIIGAGIVQWSKSDSQNSDVFLSGLSFTDRACQHTVGRRMWASELTAV